MKRQWKEEKQIKKCGREKLCCNSHCDGHPCFLPGLVIGLHGLDCQWMCSLLCALPLYRCHLSHKQTHNSWVNHPSSSPTRGLFQAFYLFFTLSITHSESITHHSKSTRRLQTNINTLSLILIQTELVPWRFSLRVCQLDGVV